MLNVEMMDRQVEKKPTFTKRCPKSARHVSPQLLAWIADRKKKLRRGFSLTRKFERVHKKSLDEFFFQFSVHHHPTTFFRQHHPCLTPFVL